MEKEIIEFVREQGYVVNEKTKTISTIYRDEVRSESVRYLIDIFGYKLQLGMFSKSADV